MVDSILINNGYKKPLDFDNKVNEIFHLGGNNKLKDPVLLDFGSQDGSFDPHNDSPYDLGKELFFSAKNGVGFDDDDDQYVSKKLKLITPFYLLPLLVDYQKEFPKLVNNEQEYSLNKTATFKKWSDIPDISKNIKNIINRIVSLNKYLFNNDKSQLMYLWANDSTVMKALLLNFGYTKDENLLRMSLQNYSPYTRGYGNDGYLDLGSVVFTGDKNNHLEIREDILKYIEKTTTKDDGRLYYSLYLFAQDLLDGKITGDDGKQQFTTEEKRKIIAYIANYNDKIFETFGMNNIELPVTQKYPLLAYLFHKDPTALEDIKKHNYYGLLNLKELIEYADMYSNIVS